MADEPIVFRLDEMSGFEFEDAVETLFSRLGYRASVADRVADLGRDVIARSTERTLVIECKHTESSVGRPVVQKLHSAAMSFEGEARGLIVTSSDFTDPAREHAAQLDDVELWDYPRLVEQGRTVGLYFTSREEGTEYVFQTDERRADATADAVAARLREGLTSRPVPLDEALRIEPTATDHLPALRIDYELDEQFGSSTYPNLYRARARGTALIALDEGELPAREEQIWSAVSFSRRRQEPLDGKPPAALFGVDLRSHEDRIKRRIARRKSTEVSYTGRNNQTYTKECRVDPQDVQTRTRQILLPYAEVDLHVGPNRYGCRLTACRQQPPRLTGARGADPSELADLVDGRSGMVCNDCATLHPTDTDPAPDDCHACGRTLCHDHHWDHLGRLPLTATPYCSDCYPTDREGPTFYAAALLTVALAATGGLGLLYGTDQIATALGLAWLASLAATLHAARRLLHHRANLDQLADYEPEWIPDR